MALHLEHVNDADVLRVIVHDRRLDARLAPELKAGLAAYISVGWEWIILDLSAVEFADSSALGAIVAALKMLGRSGDLVIAGAQPGVVSLFSLTRMDRVFRMFPDGAQAVAALKSRV
ncbi:MAG: hypothetical protein AMXMBFR57_14330 [Acidimicrobiia bacterium]|jgi:anti-sigma B factor antagonist